MYTEKIKRENRHLGRDDAQRKCKKQQSSTKANIWSWVPKGARNQDGDLTERQGHW